MLAALEVDLRDRAAGGRAKRLHRLPAGGGTSGSQSSHSSPGTTPIRSPAASPARQHLAEQDAAQQPAVRGVAA